MFMENGWKVINFYELLILIKKRQEICNADNMFNSIILIVQVLASALLPQERKVLVYQNATYEPEIRTVLLYPEFGNESTYLRSSVAPFSRQDLILEFDDLVQDPEDYKVRIIACDWDWNESDLRPLDYLVDYNEFNIQRYEFSVDVKLKYVHYWFQVPRVTRPGNYLLVVYRGTNEKDIVLSHRFMIYGDQISIGVTSNLNGLTSVDRTRQQLDFVLNYGKVNIPNPLEQVRVVVRQNQRWDNTIAFLQPSFLREVDAQLEYRFFNFENAFFAGSEFRFFDMRSLMYPGQNVAYVERQKRPIEVVLAADKFRGTEAYSRLEDINGDFIVANSDTGNGVIESDYVRVIFSLVHNQKIPGEVYVVGQMNNYNLTPENRMQYQAATGTYQATLLLKQGWYNYKYEVKSDSLPVNYFEGSHFETENEYEIFVYYDPLTERGEYLMGYKKIRINPF
jgi:hypothetical protein